MNPPQQPPQPPSPMEALNNLDVVARQHNGTREVHQALAVSLQVLGQVVSEHAEMSKQLSEKEAVKTDAEPETKKDAKPK